jgi:dolichol-phosphate mannosyltransferase
MAGIDPVLELPPLSLRPQHEHGDDAHPGSGDDRPDEHAEAERHAAVSFTLHRDQPIADQTAGEAADEHRHEGERSGRRGRQGRHRRGFVHGRHPTGAVGSEPVRVVVVVPTYNEAENVSDLVRSIRAALPVGGIIVVDDASPDGTADLAEALVDEVGDLRVVRRQGKSGIGSAYREGFRRAMESGCDVIVQMDADFSHDPAVIPALVANVEHGADLAIGSRYVPGARTLDWPRDRRVLSRWGNRYAAGVLGLAVNDATGGFRAYSADALRRVDYATVQAEGYAFQVEMTHRLIGVDGRIVEFPITFVDRRAGTSKMSKRIVGEAFMLVLRLWVADRRGRRRRRSHGG